MKIGILTYHRSINYGAFMQSYALSQRLNEIENVDAEIIDYMSRNMHWYYKMFTLYRGKKSILKIKNRIEMYKSFKKDLKYLSLSKYKIISNDEKKVFKKLKNTYDIIIVGSDAVWNFEKRGLPNPYFLLDDFKNTKKISYAASCNGLKYDKVTPEQKAIIKKALSDFNYIGVRDILTEKMVNEILQKDVAIHNCDPTFLLDFEKDKIGEEFVQKLKTKLIKKYKWDTKKKHIGLMLSNLNGNLAKRLVHELKNKYGDEYQIVSIYSYCEYADIKYISDLTPLEWSRIFSLFDITFSKYFHGTLLSLKNLTPVIAISAEYKIKDVPSKVEDVLKRLDLDELYFEAKCENDINWSNLMKKVDELLIEFPKNKISLSINNEKESGIKFLDYIKSMSRGGTK